MKKRILLTGLITLCSVLDISAPTNLVSYAITPPKIEVVKPVIIDYDSLAAQQINTINVDSVKRLIQKEIKPTYTKLITKRVVKFTINQESGYNPYLKNPSGARGLMQIMEEAWITVDTSEYISNVYNPHKNLQVGIKVLIHMQRYCKQTVPGWDTISPQQQLEYTLMVYNYGPRKMEKINWDITKIPRETRDYIINATNTLYPSTDTLKQNGRTN